MADADAAHIAISHLPVVLSLLGAAAAAVAFVLRRRAVLLYAVATLALAGLSSSPALYTGHEAMRLVEHRWYADQLQIQRHRGTARNANLLMLATGALALAAWWQVRRSPREVRPGGLLTAMVLVAGVCSATAMGWTSWQGSYIVTRNPRLMRSAAPPGATPAPMAPGMDHSKH